MKTRLVILISLAFNVAMAIAVVFLVKKPATPVSRLTTLPTTVTQSAPQSEPQDQPATNGPATGLAFQWSQIASEDLKIYRNNLLAIGCPKTTVHDILLGEINDQFALRRQNILASLQNQFWDFAVRGEQSLRNEWRRPIDVLAAERLTRLDDLFGKDYGIAEAESQANRELSERHFLWLSVEKRDQLSALDQKYQGRRKALLQSIGRTDEALTPQDKLQLEQLENEFQNARKELLTPEELEEARLRSSKESLWAIGLSGFEPTESEWRTVTRLRTDFEEAQRSLTGLTLSDEERQRRQQELQSELERSTKEALGPARYHEYETAGDGAFQDLHKVTQRYGLSNNIATHAYQLQQDALAKAGQLRNDSSLSAEMRQAELDALQKQTELQLAKTLGGKVLSTYKQYGGNWLNELNQIQAP